MKKNICIIASEFNKDLVEELYSNASKKLAEENLTTHWVAGAGEIPLATKWAAESKKYDGILALGAVIRGETTHYDSLSKLLENSLWDLQNQSSLPIVFCVLMVENKEQARIRTKRRAEEAAYALTQMMELKTKI